MPHVQLVATFFCTRKGFFPGAFVGSFVARFRDKQADDDQDTGQQFEIVRSDVDQISVFPAEEHQGLIHDRAENRPQGDQMDLVAGEQEFPQHGGKCAVAQFIKGDPRTLDCGEWKAAEGLGVLWKDFGAGFTWEGDNKEKNRALCIQGWEQAKRWISSGDFDLLVLDEFTYAFSLGYLDAGQVSLWLGDHHAFSDTTTSLGEGDFRRWKFV